MVIAFLVPNPCLEQRLNQPTDVRAPKVQVSGSRQLASNAGPNANRIQSVSSSSTISSPSVASTMSIPKRLWRLARLRPHSQLGSRP